MGSTPVGLTQEALATKAHISRIYVNKLASGKYARQSASSNASHKPSACR
jgi:hypothetical protein